MTSPTIKVLTVRQPWASLIATQAKHIETRGWRTSHRGWLAIHAGVHVPPATLLAREPFATALRHVLARGPLPCGTVVAVARLVEVVPITATFADALDPNERAFGDYGPNRWAWRLADVQPLDHPIPARGALSLWDWEPPRSVRAMLDLGQ